VKALSVLLCLAFLGCRGHDVTEARRTVVDSHGRSVAVQDKICRVACVDVLCYGAMLTLGEADKVVSMQVNAARAPWAVRVRAQSGIRSMETSPGIEELLRQKVDVVVGGYGGGSESHAMAAAEIPQLAAQPARGKFATAREFLDGQEAMMRIYGKLLGPAAASRAEDWCAWLEEKARFVTARTGQISSTRLPKAYFVRGPSTLATHGPGGAGYWYCAMAGADMVVKNRPGMQRRGDLSMEEVLRWDPEYVFIDRQYPAEIVTRDLRWKNVKAVREGKVILVPAGVFYWDGGPESALLMLFLAKRLHPDLFPDLDLAAEVKGYYRRFYKVTLSDREVTLMLSGLDPQGRRENPWKI